MRLLFFAHLKDAAGQAEMPWHVDHPVTAPELWQALAGALPGFERFRSTTRLARNGEYADADARFVDGDEVAFIPPVSGG